jgi:hypothetical protein
MRVYGVDFTSAPRKGKPMTVAKCVLHDGVLELNSVDGYIAFEAFEQLLASDGPWIAGLDFPFGQPRKLITNLNLPLFWSGYVSAIATMSKKEFEETLTFYRKDRQEGDKQHMRLIDKKAKSCSPMMLFGVPVAKMFFEGSPRLLRSGANILPNRFTSSSRTVVEAYPALVARKFISKRSYKNDTKSKQTAQLEKARRDIVQGICSGKLKEIYGLSLKMDNKIMVSMIEEPTADLLDALLCAIQAAWAYKHKTNNYGIPKDCDPVEGWITDPEMMSYID